MSLRERLENIGESRKLAGTEASMPKNSYAELKKYVHTAILERINLERLKDFSEEDIKKEINDLVSVIIDGENIALNQFEKKTLAQDVQYEMFGLGPLEPLLKDNP